MERLDEFSRALIKDWDRLCVAHEDPQEIIPHLCEKIEAHASKSVLSIQQITHLIDKMMNFVADDALRSDDQVFEPIRTLECLGLVVNLVEGFGKQYDPKKLREEKIISDRAGENFVQILKLFLRVVLFTREAGHNQREEFEALVQLLVHWSIVAHVFLGCSRHTMEVIANDEEIQYLAEVLRWYNEDTRTFHMLVSTTLDEKMIVLDSRNGKGYEVRVDGVVNNAQLSVLLQNAIPHTHPINHNLVSVYDGSGPQMLPLDVVEKVHMLNWMQVADTKARGNTYKIWGQGVVKDIAKFEGTRIVLLHTPIYDVAFPCCRVFLNVPASVVVEKELSAEDVNLLCDKIRLSTPEQKYEAVQFLNAHGSEIDSEF